MSNQACLFAENTKTAYNPESTKATSRAVHIAGAAYQIPAFWLLCFDSDTDFVDVTTSVGTFSTVVAPLADVRQRLADRTPLAAAMFPKQMAAWALWQRVVGGVAQRYLKLDPYKMWLLSDDEDPTTISFNSMISDALDWVGYAAKQAAPAKAIRKTDDDLRSLLALAGLDGRYDFRRRTFTFDAGTECAERFLYGWYELKDAETGLPPDNVPATRKAKKASRKK